MNSRFCFLCFFILICSADALAQAGTKDSFRSHYYQVLNSSDLQSIDFQLDNIIGKPVNDSLAFSGALLMKKAGLMKSPGEKLSTFKDGRSRLEQSIKNDSSNIEYRFLRLIIQENAPSIMRYYINMEEDKNFILQKFSQVNSLLKREIVKYSSSSKSLKSANLVE
jgi:hypothetical protein